MTNKTKSLGQEITIWKLECCIFWSAFGSYTLQTLFEIVIFSVFCAKKQKKQEICSKILQITLFLSLHQNAGRNIQHLSAIIMNKDVNAKSS